MIRFLIDTHRYEEITLDFAKGILQAAKGVLADTLEHGKPEHKSSGICENIETKLISFDHTAYVRYEIIDLVARCAVKWDHPANASCGAPVLYPIVGAHNFGAWEGPNKEARLSLLRYVIKRLGDAIRRAEKNGKATIK